MLSAECFLAYFGLFSSTGLWFVPVALLSGWRGVHALGFIGALGSTPKSQTKRLICFFSSSSTTAYSPGGRGSEGVILTQSPSGALVTGIHASFWLTLPYTATLSLPTMRTPFFDSTRTMP